MQRRDFFKSVGVGSVALSAAAGDMQAALAKTEYQWKMVTTWPKNFPGLGTGANRLAALIGEMSGGRIAIQVYGAGELIPAFEVFETVSKGTAEMGHGAAYYWKNRSEAAQFFASVPFGMTAQEVNGWLYSGGGLELWTELYREFGLVPAPAGNSGVQMGGWFNREIKVIADFEGLKMRIPGLGGDVLARAGGIPVALPGGELFSALQEGKIDAAKWVGPYNDLAFGLHKVARYYYYPGWQEPGATMEAIINRKAYEALPADLRTIIMNACKVVNLEMLAEYTARNPAALHTLISKYSIELRPFPDAVLARLRQLTEEVVSDIARQDEFISRVFTSYKKFQTQSEAWNRISGLTQRLSLDHL